MKYSFLVIYALSLAYTTQQECLEKAGLTECNRTPVQKTEIQKLNSQITTLSMKHGPSNTEVAAGTFRTIPQLENLYLSFSNIKTLEPGCFQGLANLKQLYLTNNDLDTISNGVFDPCRRLKVLHLNLNKIRTISNSAFNEIVELEELDLSSNLLEGIPSLSVLESLKKLNLAYNKLTTVESGSFSSLARLNWLRLSDNQISTIQNGAFQGLGNLNELDIRSNHLTNLDVFDILKDSRILRNISISLNDFRCSDLREIITQLQRNNIEVTQGVSKNANAINGISCKN